MTMRTAAMEWEAFRLRCVLDEAPKSAVRELRQVFYAGLGSGVRLVRDHGESIEALAEELDRMVEAEMARVSGEAWAEDE